MSTATENANTTVQASGTLEDKIAKAIQKTHTSKKSDLCHYIEYDGFHIQHLKFHHMCLRDPNEAVELIDQYILSVDKPKVLAPPPRKRRGASKVGKDRIVISRSDLEKIIAKLKKAGDHELASNLRLTLEPLKMIKKQLLALVRSDGIDDELWDSYKASVRRKSKATS